jgi:LysR family hydrogen peroxide-inducible transcriptional activator
MDLRQLNAFLAVVEHGGFSAAARALHTVQSNVSTHVARLEQELGATLIDRATGQPTAEGDAVLTRATRVRAELEALSADVASMGTTVAGTVRLGMIGTTAQWLAPRLFEAAEVTHPDVRLVLVDATTTSLLPQVDRGDLDLAVVNLPAESPDTQTEPLFDEDRILLAPEGHPLAASPSVSLATVAEHDLLLEPIGTAFRDELDADAARAGVRLRTRAEVDGMRLLTSLVFAGFGAAVLPASAVAPGAEGPWRVVAVEGLAPRRVGLAQRRRALLSSPAQAVRDLLVDVVEREARRQPGLRPTPSRR